MEEKNERTGSHVFTNRGHSISIQRYIFIENKTPRMGSTFKKLNCFHFQFIVMSSGCLLLIL